jgi:hypothetical protein
MPKESRDIAQAVRFVPMYGRVIVAKGGFKRLSPDAVELAEAFPDKTLRCGIRALLRVTLDYHACHFDLEERGQ